MKCFLRNNMGMSISIFATLCRPKMCSKKGVKINSQILLFKMGWGIQSVQRNRMEPYLHKNGSGDRLKVLIYTSPQAKLLSDPSSAAPASMSALSIWWVAASFAPAVSCLSQVCQEIIVHWISVIKTHFQQQECENLRVFSNNLIINWFCSTWKLQMT